MMSRTWILTLAHGRGRNRHGGLDGGAPAVRLLSITADAQTCRGAERIGRGAKPP